MVWYQLKIESCPDEQVELLSEALEAHGALSVMLTDKNDDPILEPEPGTTPLWPETVIQALFTELEEAQQAMDHMVLGTPSLQYSIEILPDKDWERVCMDSFKPQQFGARLWICPSWLTPPVSDAVNVILDPGLAFGTGTHPTTALCLTWLEQAKLENKTLIDYGCGSGILSLAALKLGAHHVQAVDIDPQALQATSNNALSNAIQDRISITAPESAQGPVDLIIANILLNPLMHLKTHFYHLLKEEGHVVVSGILSEQVSSLIEAYKDMFSSITMHHKEEWSLVQFSKRYS